MSRLACMLLSLCAGCAGDGPSTDDDVAPTTPTADTGATIGADLVLEPACLDLHGPTTLTVSGAPARQAVTVIVLDLNQVVGEADAGDDGIAQIEVRATDDWGPSPSLQATTGSLTSATVPMSVSYGITGGGHPIESTAARFTGVTAGGLAGDKVAGGDLDGDGLVELVVGAKEAGAGGTVYVVDPSVGDVPLSNAAGTWRGPVGSFAGGSVAVAPDLTGDGIGDVLVGGKLAGADDRGSAWVLAGPAAGDLELETDAHAQLVGAAAGDLAGGSVVSPGDVDGDGAADLLVGANEAGDGGAVFLLRGPVAAGSGSLDGADALWTGAPGERLPSALSHVGDLDGDGRDDLVVCAGDAAGGDGLCAWLPFTGPGEHVLADAQRTWTGPTGARLGELAGPGDVDGDGLPDLLFGAAEADGGAGAVWVLPGTAPSGEAASLATGTWNGAPGAQAGFSVSGAGDVDGDGLPELLVGAEAEGPGRVYLIAGTETAGTRALADAWAWWVGAAAGDRLGHEVAGPGDVDGDGYDDLFFGAPRATTDAGPAAGMAVLVWGGPGW